jgi:hypothetical protein
MTDVPLTDDASDFAFLRVHETPSLISSSDCGSFLSEEEKEGSPTTKSSVESTPPSVGAGARAGSGAGAGAAATSSVAAPIVEEATVDLVQFGFWQGVKYGFTLAVTTAGSLIGKQAQVEVPIEDEVAAAVLQGNPAGSPFSQAVHETTRAAYFQHGGGAK